MSAMEIDFYEVLGVSRSADDGAIKAAYRKLAMQYHPDRNGGCKDHEDKFKAVSAAYECLKDPQKRAAYDRFGHAAFQNGGMGGGAGADFADLGDIFETIFGSAFGGGRQQARRGADLRYDMEITLDEAFHGESREIEIEVSQACDTCHGSGATPGTGARRCNLCGGQGKVRAKQGFFVVERPCPNCHGAGQVIENPCRSCGGEGRVDRPQKLEVEIPPGTDHQAGVVDRKRRQVRQHVAPARQARVGDFQALGLGDERLHAPAQEAEVVVGILHVGELGRVRFR